MSTLLAVIIVIALVFGVLCFEGWIFMLLANWVLSLFSVAFAFTFWQAFGVVLLLSFIGGFFKSSNSSKQWGEISTLFYCPCGVHGPRTPNFYYTRPHTICQAKNAKNFAQISLLKFVYFAYCIFPQLWYTIITERECR